ncbi:uncharacterized protein NEMAJ01_1590 [Nematocida major]|uniref:uncharacterized protein n=1 Tax=Nematocida major TaxID=1912982 RepID=UPI002008AC38|nr:uncharacterized protein NEMAJ01_1590 [Nematocida major]KAH9386694.1 hypothetical protein NEMAJ01_1590 [Nematocida major]
MASPVHSPRRSARKVTKKMTYAALVMRAIQASPFGRSTIDEIYEYVAKEYQEDLPGELSGVWQSCIRQILSRDARFIKLPRMPGVKVSEWIYFPPFGDSDSPPPRMNQLKQIRKELKKKGTYKVFKIKKEREN